MIMDWDKILSEIGIVTVISGLIVWLIKQLGQMFIDRNISIYKQELQNKSDLYKAELNQVFEKYKSDIAFHSQKAFKLHDRRLEKIDELYSLLSDFYNDMFTLTTWKIVTGMTKEEINKQSYDNTMKAGESGNKFLSYYDKNKLYFNSETCTLIDEIIQLLKESHSDFSFKYIFGNISPQMEMESIKKATEKIRRKVPEVKVKLEKNFREIIGVEN
ncbi:hypothetical protein EAH69_13735 [Faecalibacter macacae]|uniref:Uncharacterized protein n=2 Tax=Faecalibacter macacae TaxID=1859289 RepID=A0A3L9LZP2_9FLAO|nr:hypothetical protein EAH69_13735 [Faecalibacter macacae]